jgi:hypothetical protein
MHRISRCAMKTGSQAESHVISRILSLSKQKTLMCALRLAHRGIVARSRALAQSYIHFGHLNFDVNFGAGVY